MLAEIGEKPIVGPIMVDITKTTNDNEEKTNDIPTNLEILRQIGAQL